MDNDGKTTSFGRYLMGKRLEKGISLKAVSQATRIGEDMLCLIENEDHSGLPAEVFVRGFLRAYAKAVGAQGDRAVALYHESRRLLQSANRFEEELLKTRERFWGRMLLPVLMLCGLVAATIAVEIRLHPGAPEPVKNQLPPPTDTTVAPAAPAAIPEPATLPPLETPQPDSSGDRMPIDIDVASEVQSQEATVPDLPPSTQAAPEIPVEAVAEKLKLQIVAVEDTWLKVIVDAQNPKEYFLKPSDRLELEADSGFNLLIGNATGLELFLNSRPVRVAGGRGQVVTLQIP